MCSTLIYSIYSVFSSTPISYDDCVPWSACSERRRSHRPDRLPLPLLPLHMTPAPARPPTTTVYICRRYLRQVFPMSLVSPDGAQAVCTQLASRAGGGANENSGARARNLERCTSVAFYFPGGDPYTHLSRLSTAAGE